MIQNATWLPPSSKTQALKSSFRLDNLNEFITGIEFYIETPDPRDPVYSAVEQMIKNKTESEYDL